MAMCQKLGTRNNDPIPSNLKKNRAFVPTYQAFVPTFVYQAFVPTFCASIFVQPVFGKTFQKSTGTAGSHPKPDVLPDRSNELPLCKNTKPQRLRFILVSNVGSNQNIHRRWAHSNGAKRFSPQHWEGIGELQVYKHIRSVSFGQGALCHDR